MITIMLNYNEVEAGMIVGARRRMESIFKKYHNPPFNGKDPLSSGWAYDIEAACAEVAVAKYYGVYWDFSVNTFKAPDVGHRQVRHTPLVVNGCLILRPDDDDTQEFYLVTGMAPTCNIIGYILAKDGKQDKWYDPDMLGDPQKPYWKVPQKSLIPIGPPIPPSYFDLHPEDAEWYKDPNVWLPLSESFTKLL